MAVTKEDIDSTIEKTIIEVEVDMSEELEGVKNKKQVKKDIGLFVRDLIAKDMDGGRSSVSGKQWKPLSKEYKAIKRSLGKSGKADLELTSDLVTHFGVKNTKKGFKLFVKGSDNELKAHGHITGMRENKNVKTLTGNKKRQFLPEEGEAFRKGIMIAINAALKEVKEDDGDEDI